jgi:Fe-Mn family superoxide dismutase
MKFTLPPLPYAKDALEPYVSGLTLEVHYEKHHRGYLEKLEKLVNGKPEEQETLEQLIRTAQGDVYDNAAQVWNHTFYWHSLRPERTRPAASCWPPSSAA